jgi:hypothetical protein
MYRRRSGAYPPADCCSDRGGAFEVETRPYSGASERAELRQKVIDLIKSHGYQVSDVISGGRGSRCREARSA